MKTTLTFTFLFIWVFGTVKGLGNSLAYPKKDSLSSTPTGNPGKLGNVVAQQKGEPGKPAKTENPSTSTSRKTGPATTISKVPYVIDVSTPIIVNAEKEAIGEDLIRIKISNPIEFMNSRPADRNRIELYADDLELKGITSDVFNNVSKATFKTTDSVLWISFVLKRDSTTKAAWDNLYRLAKHWYKNKAKVQLSVGWEGMMPLEIAQKDLKKTEVTLILFSNAVFVWMVVSYLVLLIGLGTLVLTTDILKEGHAGAFSLAQTQLAFWTILVLAGFIYSLLITGIPSTMNTSILTLLGISMGTTGIAKYIDYFRKSTAVAPYVTATLYSPKTPRGFWQDILGDGESINMQRFQILAWNIVLGAYFTFFTFHNKTMPIIPDVLLTLAGMSSLTYVVSKPTETTSVDGQKAKT